MLKFIFGLGLVCSFTDVFGMDDSRPQGSQRDPGATPYMAGDPDEDGDADSRRSDFAESDLGEFDSDDAEEVNAPVLSEEYVDPYSVEHQPVGDGEEDVRSPRMTFGEFDKRGADLEAGKRLFGPFLRIISVRDGVNRFLPQEKIDFYMALPELFDLFPENQTVKQWVISNCIELVQGKIMGINEFMNLIRKHPYLKNTSINSIERLRAMKRLIDKINHPDRDDD